MRINSKTALAAAVGVIGLVQSASATTYSATLGQLSASVTFTFSGNTLTVVLANTSSADVTQPNQVLTGVFFNLAGNPVGGDPSTAVLTAGSSVAFGPTGPGGDVSGEWAYAAGVNGPGAATQGISSSGFGIFGGGGTPFDPGGNLQGPAGVDGLQYGITSAGDNLGTGNTPVTGSNALIKNSVTFTLTFAGAVNVDAITDISFQYGTALNEPNVPCCGGNIPDSGNAVILLGLSLLGLGGLSYYHRRQRQVA
jgi:hypothetical protein